MKLASASILLPLFFCALAASKEESPANVPLEIPLTAQSNHDDPFNTVVLDVIFTDPHSATLRVPAFWAGGNSWKARYASSVLGTHTWKSECNDSRDAGLHGVTGSVEIVAYRGENPLYLHGPIKVAADKRHFVHADGTPFFWLGDTWWMGLCQRLHWPDEFAQLAEDRRAKGFTVVQIVAGLYPDMDPFDPRGANEAGFPWEKDYVRIRPEYFDKADERIRHLVEQGISPCIVGAWGYSLPWMGAEKTKAHWRYLIARYGAMPVIWCAAGEVNLPWYLAKGFPYDDRKQVATWTDVTRFIRQTDPFHRLLTTHPTGMGNLNARGAIDDASLLDFDMLQTPHGQREALAPTLRAAQHAYNLTPAMPVLNGEASYEMLMDKTPAEFTRAMFWICMMSGAAGHTYGANGIWQCNRREQPHGKSPHGGSYGVIAWDDAMRLPGSSQVAAGKRFFSNYAWQDFAPMPGAAAWADQTSWGDWIWYPEGDPQKDAPVAARFFRKSFDAPEGTRATKATLHISADDKFSAWLNGEKIGEGADWRAPAAIDVANHIKGGRNVIAIRAENAPGPLNANPAGLIATLEIEFENKTSLSVRTDATWLAEKSESPDWTALSFDDSKWKPALVAAHYGAGPWGAFDGKAGPPPLTLGRADTERLVYGLSARAVLIKTLRPSASYTQLFFDPVTGERSAAEQIRAGANGEWRCMPPAWGHDWVLSLVIINAQ
ncbi:MAG TPA: DUF4038 domain-containing protein [Planctomycetota bacterium]|nr:DUF4038 domain-containing protein [Planctomycetota bacterium]